MAGATRQENYLEVTDDVDMFTERTGLLWHQWQVKELGFHMDNTSGMFWESATVMLKEFCTKNPRYHIVSAQNGRFENKYVPGKNVYMLASGDTNPNLMLDMCLKKDPNLLMEEMLDEALAIDSSVNRGYKSK